MELAETMQNYNIALSLLKEKGYKIWINSSINDLISWAATKGDTYFSAYNPLALLALTQIAEKYGEDWYSYNKTDIYGETLKNFFDE